MRFISFGKNSSKDRCLEDLVTHCGGMHEAFAGIIKCAISQLINRGGVWDINAGEEGRLWLLQDGGVYVAWSNAWRDILELLSGEHFCALLDYPLAAAGLHAAGVIESNGKFCLYLIQPDTWASLKSRSRCDHAYAVKIKDPDWLGINKWPEPVSATFARMR